MLFLYIDNILKICYNVLEIKTLTIKSYEMKKVIMSAIIALSFTATVSAQCNCPIVAPAAQKPIDPMAFNPGVFTPTQMGSYQKGTAYLKEAPQLKIAPISIIAYVQMLDATGKLWEVPISGVMEASHIPSDWKNAFWEDYYGRPVQYPKPIPVTIQVKGALKTNGQQLLDAKGNPVPVTDITFN
jgi:hypothetical protein